MPTAILDLDLARLPLAIELPARYRTALALVRFHGRPTGRVTLPVVHGRAGGGGELREALIAAAGWPVWVHWLEQALPLPDDAPPPPPATVAVCTRDRIEDLRRCLTGLAAMPDDGQETIVVDNCPVSDETRRLTQEFAGVRYVREDRPGLDNARNRALREARHEIVAFIDDDAIPDPAWLRGHLRSFRDPLVLCSTGLTMPLELETEAQEWFERQSSFSRGFLPATFELGDDNPLIAGRVGAGVNMALRRSIVSSVGEFDPALDAGTPSQSGGDHEMFTRILSRGYRIAYQPSALNWHRHRRTWPELRRAIYGYGTGVYAAWTRALLVDRELSVLALAAGWLRGGQLRALTRALLRRPGAAPLDLVLAELRGCLGGPLAYLAGRRRAASSR
jgi:cellulose synthase/poly-beta-1,6-N-acetylglucosamine synthase-like glycosyltransferase